MRTFYRILHDLFFTRAVLRGPAYFLGYELRRQARRAMYRATRRLR
jgi:hypothetical protein